MQICTVLNSLSPSNNASKCSHKLSYGNISFAVLIPEGGCLLVRQQLTSVLEVTSGERSGLDL